MTEQPINELIRAELFHTRRHIGAHVTDTGKATYAPKNPPVKRTSITNIRSSWEGFDKAHKDTGSDESRENVENIKASIKRGKKVPPIIVRRNPKGLGYEIVDGNHRYHAHKEAGSKEVDIQVVPPVLAQGKHRKRITGKRKKMEEHCGCESRHPETNPVPVVSTIRKIVRQARDKRKYK